LTLQDVIDLYNEKAGVHMYEKDIEFLLAMSMMTVSNENHAKNKYEMLALPEFFELIGRSADFKFAGSELEGFSLAQKIEYFLDLLFPPFELVRQLVLADNEEQSQSDSEY
jgi:hypothetical protein